MNIEDLTPEERALIDIDFGEEIEKQASAYVDELEESQSDYSDLIEYGEDLGIKIAESLEEKYEEGKDEGKTKEEKEKEKMHKEASEAAYILCDQVVGTLQKLGEAHYGDSRIYLEEMAKQAGKKQVADSIMKKLMDHFKSVGSKAVGGAKDVGLGAQAIGKGMTGPKSRRASQKALGAAAMKSGLRDMAPAAGYGALGAGALGAGGYYAKKKMEKEAAKKQVAKSLLSRLYGKGKKHVKSVGKKTKSGLSDFGLGAQAYGKSLGAKGQKARDLRATGRAAMGTGLRSLKPAAGYAAGAGALGAAGAYGLKKRKEQ